MSVTAKIKSGLVIGKWLERGITFRERRGVVRGYFFTNNKGGKMKSKELEVGIFDRIAVIKRRYPTLIRPGVEIHEEYELSRSFRQGSNS